MATGSPPMQTATPEWFLELLTRYRRVAIAGGANTGKTTLASLATDRLVISTDEWLPESATRPAGPRHNPRLDWSGISADVVRVCAEIDSFVVEGTRVPHALRKGLPVDAVVVLHGELEPLTPEQVAQTKAVHTVLADFRVVARCPVFDGSIESPARIGVAS